MTMIEPICAQATMDTLGALTINSVLMHIDGCWNILNPQKLWMPNGNRGANVVISKARGERPYPYRTGASSYTLTLVVDGMNDWNDQPYDSVWVGLETNLEYLYDQVFQPPTAPLSTYPGELVKPSGDIWYADVQAKYPSDIGGAEDFAFIFDFPLIVPDGRFEPATS